MKLHDLIVDLASGDDEILEQLDEIDVAVLEEAVYTLKHVLKDKQDSFSSQYKSLEEMFEDTLNSEVTDYE